MNSFKQIFLVLVKPAKAFEKVKTKPIFLIPFIVIILTSLIYTSTSMLTFSSGNIPKMSEEEIQQNVKEMRKNGASEKDIKEAEESMRNPEKFRENQSTSFMIMPVVFSLVSLLFGLMLASVFFYLATKLLTKEEVMFKTNVSFITLAWVPFALKSIIQIIATFITKTPLADLGMARYLDITKIGSSISHSLLFAFLQKIDLFSLWSLVLMIVGLVVIFKYSYKKAVPLVASYFLISTVVIAIPMFLSLLMVPGLVM